MKNKNKDTEENPSEENPSEEKELNPEIKLGTRDENGLLNGIDYIYKNGFIDWRSMINPDQLYINEKWFNARNIDKPNSIDGLKDHQLLIKLGGIKEVARLRGFESINCYELKSNFDHRPDMIYAVYKCSIKWIPNFENPNGAIYEDVGSVHCYNADEFSLEYADTIAYNRAFVRCVRNFLGIHICSIEEINRSKDSQFTKTESTKTKPSMSSVKSHGALEEAAIKNKLKTFEEFKEWASSNGEVLYAYESYTDIPSRKVYSLLSKLNSQ